MSLNNLTLNNGVIRLYDGTLVYIDSVQYSHDGITNWEDPPFQPNIHTNTITGVGTLEGHKYRRVRLSGTTNYQYPEYIVAEDGRSVELNVIDGYIVWRLIGDTIWLNLVDLTLLKGSKGDQGVEGRGINIDGSNTFDLRPNCTGTTTYTRQNNCGCGYVDTLSACSPLFTFLSIGNHRLNDIEDTGTYFIQSTSLASTWTLYSSALHAGKTCIGWGATDVTGTGGRYVIANVIAVYPGTGSITAQDSTGYLYTCANGIWLVNQLAVNDHMVQEATGSTHIGYMNSYTNNITPVTANNIGILNGLLGVSNESIGVAQLDPLLIGDGLELTTDLHVNPNDLVTVGGGIIVSSNDFIVKPSDFIGDGLEIDGGLIVVKTENLISQLANNGLQTSASDDLGGVSKHLSVKVGNGIEIVTAGVQVKAGDNSILVDSAGVKAKVSNGLEVVTGGIVVKPEDATILVSALGVKVNPMYLPAGYVTSLNTKVGNLLLTSSATTNTTTGDAFTLTVDNTTPLQIDLKPNIDLAALATDLGITPGMVGTFVTADAGTSFDTASEIKTYIDTQDDKYVLKDTVIGNMYVNTVTNPGLYIELGTTGTLARLEADNNGNLYLSSTNRITP